MLRYIDSRRSFAAVILDMDGLMLDSEVAEFRAWRRAADDFGWSISDEQYIRLIGRTQKDAWRVLNAMWDAHPVNGASLSAIQDRAAGYASQEIIVVKEGLLDMLAWTRREYMPVAVASSSARATVTSRLTDAGVDALVDVIVGGDEVACGKPAPDIFLLAAKRLGCEPEACVVLEDSDSGIAAASAAAMTTFLVPDKSIPRVIPAAVRAQAHKVCGSLSEVLAILQCGSGASSPPFSILCVPQRAATTAAAGPGARARLSGDVRLPGVASWRRSVT